MVFYYFFFRNICKYFNRNTRKPEKAAGKLQYLGKTYHAKIVDADSIFNILFPEFSFILFG